MRLVTAQRQRRRFVGSLIKGGLVDLRAAHDARTGWDTAHLTSMRVLIESGAAGLDEAREAEAFAERSGLVMPLESVELRAPLPDPAALRCCSVFPGHYRNARRTVTKWLTGSAAEDTSPPDIFFKIPGYYKGNHLNITGPGDDIVWPDYADWLDFELELALVVGCAGVNIAPENWRDHVFGWTIFNDISARHPQIEEMALGTGPNKGKDFDSGNILGPCIVTADSFDGEQAMGRARVNGEEWGAACSSEMAHGWGRILAHRSRCERVYPAEVITSGTFTGCSGIDHDRPLRPGDLVELEIDGIGILANRVVRNG